MDQKTATGKHASAFMSCGVCRKPSKDKCSRCMIARYCCGEHQAQDWSKHKIMCEWLKEELARRPLKDKTPEAKELRKMQMAVVYWRRLADEQGDAEAMLRLSMCYYWGEGVEREDNKECLRLLRLAVSKGHAEAQFELGWWYYQGTYCVAVNMREAVKYYRLASDQGHAKAQSNLGNLIGGTLAGEDMNAEGLAWLLVAEENGEHTAEKMIFLMEENIPPRKMQEAKRIAAKLKLEIAAGENQE